MHQGSGRPGQNAAQGRLQRRPRGYSRTRRPNHLESRPSLAPTSSPPTTGLRPPLDAADPACQGCFLLPFLFCFRFRLTSDTTAYAKCKPALAAHPLTRTSVNRNEAPWSGCNIHALILLQPFRLACKQGELVPFPLVSRATAYASCRAPIINFPTPPLTSLPSQFAALPKSPSVASVRMKMRRLPLRALLPMVLALRSHEVIPPVPNAGKVTALQASSDFPVSGLEYVPTLL